MSVGSGAAERDDHPREGLAGYLRRFLPRRFLMWVCWAAGLIILGGAIWLGARVVGVISLAVIPMALAVLIVALLQPLNGLLCRGHLPRGLAAVITFLIFLAIIAGVATLAGFELASRTSDLIGQFQQTIDRLRADLLNSPLPIDQALTSRAGARIQQYLQSIEGNLSAVLLKVTTVTARLLTGVLLCAFLVIFLLYDGPGIWRWLTSLAPDSATQRLRRAGRASWTALTGFVQGTSLIAAIHGIVIGTTLYLLGVPAYLSLALLVALGSFVPLVGALVAGSVAVLFTLGTQGPGDALILLLVLVIENELEAHVLQPFVVGRYVRLHPVAIVLALTLGSIIVGIPGTLLAVPLTGALRAAWGPLNGRESVVPIGRPSRLSRLRHRLRSAIARWHRRHARPPDG